MDAASPPCAPVRPRVALRERPVAPSRSATRELAMANMCVLWSGSDGQTRRIVQVIEKELREAGHKLEIVNADSPPHSWSFTRPDALIVAGWQ